MLCVQVVVYFEMIAICFGFAVAAEAQQHGRHMICCYLKCEVQRSEGRDGRQTVSRPNFDHVGMFVKKSPCSALTAASCQAIISI